MKYALNKKLAAAVMTLFFIISAATVCFAGEVTDNGAKVSFLSGMNAWEMPSLSSQEKSLLKFLVGVADTGAETTTHTASAADMSGIGGMSRDGFSSVLRKDMDILLNTLCGNAFYNQVASGIKVDYSLESNGNVTGVSTTMSGSGCQAIAGANDRYKATQSKLAGMLVSEAGVTPEDSQVEALRKVNYWITTGFTYDEGAYGYTVDQALDTKRGVCGQMSQIMKFSCDYLGIPCDLIADGQMGHAYNRVTVGGNTYYIDSTWNNTNGNPDGWFLKTASEFAVDHCI